MKKLAAVFVIAVLGPAVALAWLATRSLRDQEIVVHSQRALLHQGATDALADDLNFFLDDVRVFYGRLVEELVAEVGADPLATDFDEILRSRWSQAEVGAAVTEDGDWLSPPVTSTDSGVRRFLRDTQPFLLNSAPSEVYIAPATTGKVVTVNEAAPAVEAPASFALGMKKSPEEKSQIDSATVRQKVSANEDRHRSRADIVEATAPTPAAPSAPAMAMEMEMEAQSAEQTFRTRNVTPLGQIGHGGTGDGFSRFAQAASEALADNPNRLAWSTLDVNNGQLRELMADDPEGAISRFVSGGLQVLLWRRDPAAPGKVFWVQLDLDELKSDLTTIVHEAAARQRKDAEVSLALLDSGGQVVAQTVEGFTADWRQPFVATEVGEILPHWEVAAYLLDPRAVARSARSARLTLWMLVPVLLAAIGVGGALIMRDIGREMHLARQKTDFVSNVSHELKTPLTSIRMFSDLLADRGDLADDKRAEYSGIISREAARLSRLINNLLDFSRMERGEKRYRRERIPLREFILETVETCRHQIESDGIRLTIDCPPETGTEIEGDRDALAQVLLNLLSNAEKYGGDAREIAVEARCAGRTAEIAVMDRGPGISRKNAARIFEKFFRADDSLASGIEGSGLGLTLARQIARAHNGEVEYRPRPEGGSCFLLRLPLLPTPIISAS